ncbi:MAG: tetratricopeptide repeat protein [Chlamydiales bacterium]
MLPNSLPPPRSPYGSSTERPEPSTPPPKAAVSRGEQISQLCGQTLCQIVAPGSYGGIGLLILKEFILIPGPILLTANDALMSRAYFFPSVEDSSVRKERTPLEVSLDPNKFFFRCSADGFDKTPTYTIVAIKENPAIASKTRSWCLEDESPTLGGKPSGEGKGIEVRRLYELGVQFRKEGRYEEAMEVLALASNLLFNDDSINLIETMPTMANLMFECGHNARRATPDSGLALKILENALTIIDLQIKSDRSVRLQALLEMGEVLYSQGRNLEALEKFKESLKLLQELLGEGGEGLGRIYLRIAKVQSRLEKLSEAFTNAKIALAICKESLPKNNATIIDCTCLIAQIQRKQGKLVKALKRSNKVLAICQQVFGKHHLSTAQCHFDMAETLHLQGNLQEALRSAEKALKIRSQDFEARFAFDKIVDLINSNYQTAQLILRGRQGKEIEAIQYLVSAIIYRQRIDPIGYTYALADNLGGLAKALAWDRTVLKVFQKITPDSETVAVCHYLVAIDQRLSGLYHKSLLNLLKSSNIIFNTQPEGERTLKICNLLSSELQILVSQHSDNLNDPAGAVKILECLKLASKGFGPTSNPSQLSGSTTPTNQKKRGTEPPPLPKIPASPEKPQSAAPSAQPEHEESDFVPSDDFFFGDDGDPWGGANKSTQVSDKG